MGKTLTKVGAIFKHKDEKKTYGDWWYIKISSKSVQSNFVNVKSVGFKSAWHNHLDEFEEKIKTGEYIHVADSEREFQHLLPTEYSKAIMWATTP